MSDSIRVVIGYDERETPAVWTLAHSILKHSSRPVNFTFLYLPALAKDNLMWRERDPKQSTDFSYSRFLTPYLSGYKGQSIFMDCDMLVRGDIADLLTYCPSGCDVSVVKHDYAPANQTKFLGEPQSKYPRKLWSAVMVFWNNTQACQRLTPRYINEASGADLHQFKWVPTATVTHTLTQEQEAAIISRRVGSIPEEWHWVPNHSEQRVSLEDAKLIHYTEGGPWIEGYENTPGADLWRQEAREAGVL